MAEFLYIHIPFCIRKCLYCDFLSLPYDESVAEQYAHALCRELEMKKELAGPLKTVYFGGGTPTILSIECFDTIMTAIRKHFILNDGAEITVEANPGTLTERKVKDLISLGVNRLSLGVQSFLDDELKTLGRIHNADQAIQSAEMIRSAGIDNFSLDLMYGIPGQTMKTWKRSLEQAVSLSPRHISAYELTPELHTPLKHSLDSGTIKMSPEELILGMSDFAIDFLATSGFEHYEISNYAQPGYRSMHNMNYWNRGDYLAAGAGAHAFIRGFRTRNTSDIAEYIKMLNHNTDPVIEKIEIACEEALKEIIFLGLRKTEGISLSDASDLDINLPNAAAEMVQYGLVEMTETHFRLTRKGQHIANTIIVRLFQNLGL